MLTFFHGTIDTYQADILAHGLIPAARHGCDYDWKAKAQWAWRKPAVYLAENEGLAFAFALILTGKHEGSAPCLFRVTLQDAARTSLEYDEAMNGAKDASAETRAFWKAWRYVGTIEPEWLHVEPITSETIFQAQKALIHAL